MTFSDSFLVLQTKDYFHRCWCFYEWSAAVFTGQKVQLNPNNFLTPEESITFLANLFDSFHVEDQASKSLFLQNFEAYKEVDKPFVWDNLMKIYDEEVVMRYRKKLDITQIRAWTIDQVCSWLVTIRFPQYQDKFREHQINGSHLFDLYFDHKNIFRKEDHEKVSFILLFYFNSLFISIHFIFSKQNSINLFFFFFSKSFSDNWNR